MPYTERAIEFTRKYFDGIFIPLPAIEILRADILEIWSNARAYYFYYLSFKRIFLKRIYLDMC